MEKELTPKEFFDILKEKKNTITDKELSDIYDNCLVLTEKYITTGQKAGVKKLIFHLETIEKEREIVKLGIDTFLYKDDIEEYIDNISNDVVKIIELENYEREIPDEIVETIKNVGHQFTQLYVLFTDYTGREERKVEKARIEKDPILFGTFQNKESRTVIDRFYFLGDWIDEYCDLTLDKMVAEMKTLSNKDITRTIGTPTDLDTLKTQLRTLEENNKGDIVQIIPAIKTSFFRKIRTFLGLKS